MDLSLVGLLIGVQYPWIISEVKTQPQNKVVDVFIKFEKGSSFHCPVCGELCPVYDSVEKRVRYLDLFDYRCYLNIKVPRVNCPKCGVKTSHSDNWSRPGSHYSKKFEAKIMRLSKEMSMSAVSKELGEPDNNLWRVFHYYIKTDIFDEFDFNAVKRVCVDETACKRGHSYITIFTDYDTGTVLFVTEGRSKEVFDLFYGWLWDKGGFPGAIELFCMDMSKSYIAGQKEYFAGTETVFDRFHIKKCLNKAVSNVRKNEAKTVHELKKTKYIWLKNEKKLTEKQRLELNSFLDDSSLDTAIAYMLKQGFDQIWNVQINAAEPLLETWVQKAVDTKLKPIVSFADTVYRHFEGILNAIETGITNAVSEGINSVVQLARTRARGFRNVQNYIAMVYYLGCKTH